MDNSSIKEVLENKIRKANICIQKLRRENNLGFINDNFIKGMIFTDIKHLFPYHQHKDLKRTLFISIKNYIERVYIYTEDEKDNRYFKELELVCNTIDYSKLIPIDDLVDITFENIKKIKF